MASSDPPPRRAGEPLIHAELPSPDTKRDYRLYAKQCFHEMLAMCDATNTYRRWTHGMEKGTTTHALRVSTSLEPAVRQNNTVVGTDGLVNVKITTIINAPVTLLFDAMTSPTTKSTTQCSLMGNAVYRRAVKRLTQDRSLEIFETRLGATSVFSSPREFYTLRYIRREMVYELQSSLAYVEASFNVPTVAVEAGHVRAALLLYGWLLSPVNNGVSSEVTHFLRVDLKGWLSASQINGRALELARSNVLALISTSANLTQILSTIEHEQRAASPVRAAQTLSATFAYVEEPSPVVEESSVCSWNDDILSIEGGSIGADELAGLNRDYGSDPSIRVGLDHTSDDYEDDQASYSGIEDSVDETKTPPTMEYEEVSLGSDVGPPGDGNDVDDDDRKLSDHEDDDALFESAKTPEDIGPVQHALTEEEVAATGLERESTGRPRRSSLTKPRATVLSAASLAIGLTTAVTSATSRRNSRAPPLIRPPDREAVTRPPYATSTPDATPRPKDAEVPRGTSPPRTPSARSTSTSRAEEMRAARRDKHASADAPSMQELMKRVSQSQSSTPSLQRTRSAISFARQTSGWGSQGDVGLLDGGKYGRDASGMITPTYRGGAMSLQCSTSSTPLGSVSSSRTMIIDSTSASGFLASLLTIPMRTTPSRAPTPAASSPAATPASHPVIPHITLPTNDATMRPVTPSPRCSASPRTLTTPRTTSSPRSPRTSPRPQLPPMVELEASDDMARKNVSQTSLADDRPATPPLVPATMPSTTSPEMGIDDSPPEWKPEKVKLTNMVQKKYGADFMDIMNRQLSPRGAATTITTTTTTDSDEPTHVPPSTMSFRRPSKPRSRRPSVAVALRIRDSDDYSDKTISDMASSPESISATGSLQAEAHAVEELQTCSQTWPIYAEMSATDSLSSNQFDASDSFSYRSDIDSEILKSGSSTDDGEDSYDGTEHCRSSSDSTATASIDTTSLSEHDKNLVYSLWEQHPLVVAAMQGDHGVSVPSSLPPPPSSLPPPPSSLPPTTSPPSSAAPMRPDMSTLNMTKLQRQDSDLDRQLSDQHLLNMQAATTRPPPVSGTATSRRNSVSMAVRDRSSILIPRSGARPRTLSVSTSSSSLLTPLSRSAGQNDGETTPCSTTTDSDVSPATATLNALAVISPRWTAQPDRLPFALPEKSSKFAINNSAYLTRARSHTVSSPKSTTAPRASVTTVEWEQSAPPSPSTPCAAEPAVPTARAARASTLHLQKFQPVSEPTMPVAAAVNLALELLSPRQRLSHSSSSPSLVTTPRQEVAVAAASVMASPRTTAAASPRAMPVLKSTASMSELVSPRAAPPTVVLSGAADLFFGSNTKPEKNAKETAGDVSPRTSKLKKVASKFRSLVVRSSSSSRKSAPVILTSPRVLNVSEPVAIAGWSASRDSTLANTSPLYALLAEAASELHKVPTTPRGTAIREPSGDDESPTDTELLSDTSGNVSGDDVDVDVDAEVEAVMGSALSSSDQGTYASGESTSTTPRKKSVIIKKDFERRLSVA